MHPHTSSSHPNNSNRPPPAIRGMLGEHGDDPDWLEATQHFPNGVPRFSSREEALEFMIDYNSNHGGSNPDVPHLMHIFTMLISWKQIEQHLLPNIDKARQEPSNAKKIPKDYLSEPGRGVIDWEKDGPPDEPEEEHDDGPEFEEEEEEEEEEDEDEDDEHMTHFGAEKFQGSSRRKSKKRRFRRRKPTKKKRTANMYESEECYDAVQDISFRLDLPFHVCTNPASTMNTLKYLFFHMKCGIYVMIRNGELRIFAPFVNSDYRNTWGYKLQLEGDGTIDSYYKAKAGQYRRENIEKDKTMWWANGNIICNELCKPEDKKRMQYWGDQFLAPLRDMLGEACRTRFMPDCEFFINKRDYPQLKVNVPKGEPVEPYGFIFDKDDRDPDQDVELTRCKFKTYAPIVSFYAARPDRFADLPWPSSEDWEAACGEVFPHSFMHRRERGKQEVKFDSNPRDLFTEVNFRKFERAWDDGRVATAFFRGTATGGGVTPDDNQRLKVAQLCHDWQHDPEKGGETPFLDAAIVGWNLRDKKTFNKPMTFLRKKNFAFTAGKHHFTPIYEQSKYKYLVYVDGHCAACRYGFMMRLGSVILKVAARQVADTMWYFPLLRPYVDHVPVKADLSDLEEKIRWCRRNDDKCREIGENAKRFYETYVAKEALLDYVQVVCNLISARYVDPPKWYTSPPPEEEPPKLRKPDVPCYQDRQDPSKSRLCVRCQEAVQDEAKELEQMQARASAQRHDNRHRKSNFRARMLKRARRGPN